MFFPHPSSRHRPCLVEDTACPQSSFVSSVQVMCTCLMERQSPDLIIASRNNQSVGGRLGNHNAAPHCCKESDLANSLRLCRLVLKLSLCTVQYSQDLVTATYVGSLGNLFSLPTALIGSDTLGIMSTNSSSFHCMECIPVRLPMAPISTYSIFRTPSMSEKICSGTGILESLDFL